MCKNHADAVLSLRRKRKSQHLALAMEEIMRDLRQDPCAIPALLISALAAPVLQILQDLQSIVDNIIRALAADIRHETDPASIMFISGVIQPLRLWQVSPFFHIHSFSPTKKAERKQR